MLRLVGEKHGCHGEGHRGTAQLWPIIVRATNLEVQTIGSVGLGYLRLSACSWLMEREVEVGSSIDEGLGWAGAELGAGS